MNPSNYYIVMTRDQWAEILSHLTDYPQAAKKIRGELERQERDSPYVESEEKNWRRVQSLLPKNCELRGVIDRQIMAVMLFAED